MSTWRATKSQEGLRNATAARLDAQKTGWVSSKAAQRAGWSNFTFCFHDGEEIGPAALSKIGEDMGLRLRTSDTRHIVTEDLFPFLGLPHVRG